MANRPLLFPGSAITRAGLMAATVAFVTLVAAISAANLLQLDDAGVLLACLAAVGSGFTAFCLSILQGMKSDRFLARLSEVVERLPQSDRFDAASSDKFMLSTEGQPSSPRSVLLNRLEHGAKTARTIEVDLQNTKGKLNSLLNEQAEFHAALNHELRSPLNAILGYTAILSEESESRGLDDFSSDLSRIKVAGFQLLALIDHLLGMTTSEAQPEQNRERLPFDMVKLLKNSLAPLTDRGVKVSTNIDDGAALTVFGSRDMMARTITGLIEHNLRAFSATEVSALLDTDAPSPKACQLHLDFTADASVSLEAQGRHQIAQQMCEAMAHKIGGRIAWAIAGKDRARVSLSFPIDIRNTTNSDNLMTKSKNEEPSAQVTNDMPLALVIDDDPSATDLLGRWLKRCGYRVQTAESAEEGLEMATEATPDIILLDALMPGKSGYDVLPEMRDHEALAGVPIIVVTVDDDRLRAIEAGATDYVRKPLNETELKALLSVYEAESEGDVLIIEDDEDARNLLERNIRRLGFNTRCALDGAEGLAAIREKIPSAILLDLNMPNVNGFEFIDAVAKDGELSSIPMLVVSGADLSVPEHHKLLDAGIRFYLKGTVAPREIAEGLREALA